ncbi:hypothetical protein LSTR_LSTR011391 [Laodelphax striatellus]|uniref:Uncharacterized protein n=1 Tax=Laodelphax striatellus TaxID=195883 RepID=A0A482XUK2_LAOST|nr:hypothetical protein LSTR_LSTR011391 [Laodelphax striatellus]
MLVLLLMCSVWKRIVRRYHKKIPRHGNTTTPDVSTRHHIMMSGEVRVGVRWGGHW